MDRGSPLQLKSSATLANALGVGRGDLVALVGGGGKTTAMYRLVRELRETGIRAAAATTTKIGVPSEDDVELILSDEWEGLQQRVAATRQGIPVLGRRLLPAEKVEGIPEDWCARLMAHGSVEALVVEADGSARRPVKAPAEWEPVVPWRTTIFVAVIGLSCVGMAIAAENVFRPERLATVTGLRSGDVLDPAALARLLVAEDGLYKGCPDDARALVLLNQADKPQDLDAARCIAEQVLSSGSRYRAVIAACLLQEDLPLAVWEV